MRGHDDIIEVLNEVLTAELTAVNQYFLHAKLMQNWGFDRLAEHSKHEAIDEMKHAEQVTDRILYFDGVPNYQRYFPLRIGENVPEIFQADLDQMAAHAGVPVVNALTDDFHPCQVIADLLTIREHKGDLSGLTVAFVGDGACNMGNSWLLGGTTAGMHVRISAPHGYVPGEEMFARAREIAVGTGGSAQAVPDPVEAVTGADVVVTDTWISMGKESEQATRVAVFAPYTLSTELMAVASPDAIALHCLPAYRGMEIAAEVLDGPQSVVWDEAENRRHAQKAVLAFLLEASHEGAS